MKKLNTDEFIKRAINVHNNEYDYSLVEYVNSRTKINIVYSKHGVFSQTPNNRLNGEGCLICGKIKNINSITKDTKYFIDKAKIIHGNKYDYSCANYTGALSYIDIICPTHGIFIQQVNCHLSGCGCPKCFGGVKKTQEEFINSTKIVHGNKYDYSLVNYVNHNTNIKIICPKHGEFNQTPTSHLSGNGCRICNESKGENKVALFLLNNSIEFVREKRFSNCKGKRQTLPFNFYLPKHNVLIEFDGKQHYIPINFHGCSNEKAEISCFETKKNDKIKNDFAKLNNYHLLRIKYDKINEIDEILETYEPISRK